jgi:hypothetical protein
MNNTIKTELRQHILDCINDRILTNDNQDEWHHYAFNEDYYIIYHSKAVEWLKTHSLDAFEAIDIVREYETNNFGEFTTDINPESIVNMLAYIYGEEILYSYDVENVEELKAQIENDLSNFEDRLSKTNKDFVFFNTDNLGNIVKYTFSDDYIRYKNKYENFMPTETAKNIKINLVD